MAYFRGNTYIEGTLFVQGGLQVSSITSANGKTPYFTANRIENENYPYGARDNSALVAFNKDDGYEGGIESSNIYIDKISSYTEDSLGNKVEDRRTGAIYLYAGQYVAGAHQKLPNNLYVLNSNLILQPNGTWAFETHDPAVEEEEEEETSETTEPENP